MQPFVLGKEIENGFIGAVNIFWVPRKCDPTEWSLTFAEKWANIGRDKTWEGEGSAVSALTRFIADRVSVIKYFGALIHEAHHCFDMLRHRFTGTQSEIFWVVFSEHRSIVEVDANRNVREWIMRRRLIRDYIDWNIHRQELRN